MDSIRDKKWFLYQVAENKILLISTNVSIFKILL